MKKKYVKMNSNDNYLSLGNLFNQIKLLSSNKNTAMQREIFCSLFNVSDINSTTVNNYCIGYRPIGIEYKKAFIDLKEKYQLNHDVFIPIIISLLCILDERIYQVNDDSLLLINSNTKLKSLVTRLLNIAKNDEHISNEYIEKINNYILDNNLYEAIIDELIYVVLDNNQPVYIQDINVKINKQELEEYLKIKLYEGVSYITSLKELARKNNMYACAELGSLEYEGLVSGLISYDNSYHYYEQAAKKNHPKACWMVAYLIINNKIKKDLSYAWDYLNRAIELGSSAALNTMGNCYLKGNSLIKKDVNKAKYYFKEASELGYVYAYNNLGKLYEVSDINEAIKYYKISADLGESWALNKVGEYYRLNNNLDMAYIYYLKSSECPINEKCYYSYYNLAKYFYLKTDLAKAEYYFKIAKENGVDFTN